LRCEHFVGLALNYIHFFAEFYFAPIETHQKVDVKGMDDLILLGIELFSLDLIPLVILNMPLSPRNLLFKEILVFELFLAVSDLVLLFIALIFVKSLLFTFFTDSVTFLS
jgi:hypothetical protein